MLTEGRMPPEHFARFLKESADKLRLLRDAVKEDFPDAYAAEAALDAATVIALVDPLASAMVRLSKRVKSA